MTREEMREKVGLLFCKNDRDCMGFKYCNPGCQTKTDAAIAIIRGETLEEAARVCESELVEPSDRWMSGYSDACKENAAAIRALKERK